jgi:DNA-binding transcriptional MocR family regulator
MSRAPYVRFRVRAPDPARRSSTQDIVATLVEDIAAGRLPAGARLPPVRVLYDTHLAALQHELDERYTRCLELLRDRMPEGVRWTTPGGGPTLWLEVPKRISLDRVGARLRARGVNIESAADAFDGPPHLNGFRVSYAFLAPETLDRAVGLVAEAIREELS